MPKQTTTKTKRATKGRDGGKKKKDPNAPKRGLSAYMFFANEKRDGVREENPGIQFGKCFLSDLAQSMQLADNPSRPSWQDAR